MWQDYVSLYFAKVKVKVTCSLLEYVEQDTMNNQTV